MSLSAYHRFLLVKAAMALLAIVSLALGVLSASSYFVWSLQAHSGGLHKHIAEVGRQGEAWSAALFFACMVVGGLSARRLLTPLFNVGADRIEGGIRFVLGFTAVTCAVLFAITARAFGR
jgi:hypothetical protein